MRATRSQRASKKSQRRDGNAKRPESDWNPSPLPERDQEFILKTTTAKPIANGNHNAYRVSTSLVSNMINLRYCRFFHPGKNHAPHHHIFERVLHALAEAAHLIA